MAEMKRSRRQVLKAAAGGAIGLAVPAFAQQKPPPLAGDQVKEFVIAGHGNLPRVQEMLAADPRLLNACWDWGGGDFETALEGAGHMGNKEIARFLISKGARLNIFQAAMLDEVDLVKSMISLHPELASSKGPHGIPLMAHAKAGGAKHVIDHLEKLG
jgi:hypothetical protein